MPKLFKKRRARKQAEEAARKQAIKENREANRAKREAYFKRGEESSANLKASKAASAQKAKDDAISSRVVVGGKTYTNQAAADMAQSREASKRDDLNRVRRSKNIASKKEAKGGFYEKTGSDGKTRTVISRGKEESDEAFKARSTKARAEYKPKAKDGAKVGDPKKKKSVVTVDQDLKDLGNALKEGVKMITIPGYGAMKLSQYLTKRKKGMSKTEIGKTLKQAGKESVAESTQEMSRQKTPDPAMGLKKRMVEKPTMKRLNKIEKKEGRPMMKRTMTKLIKKKDKKITLPKKTVSKIDAPKEVPLKGRKKTAKHGGALAIMIAPVKTKNKKTVRAIKKGAKAQYGAAMKKMPTYKNGGKVTDPLIKALTKGGKGKEYKTLKGKDLVESIEIKDFEMKGGAGPKKAESAKLIAKSDNIKSNKVTVNKGKEKGYGPDNDYRRKEAVEKFNHEWNMKNNSKYRIAYKKKQKAQWDEEDAERKNKDSAKVKKK